MDEEHTRVAINYFLQVVVFIYLKPRTSET